MHWTVGYIGQWLDALDSSWIHWTVVGYIGQWLDASHGRINTRHLSELPARHFVSPKSLGSSSYH